MNQKKELVKNTIIISIGKFSTKIVSFLLLPLYTAILVPAEKGQVDLLNRISLFLIPIITLQMDEALFRFLIDAKTDDDKTNVFSQLVIFSLISSFLWSILIFIFGNILNYEYTNWLIIYCLASFIYTVVNGFLRGEGNFKMYSLLAFVNSLINILLNILFLAVLKIGLIGMFLSYIIASISTGIFGFIYLKAYKLIKLRLDKNKMRDMIRYSLPLVPSSISWSIITLTDSLMITTNLGSSMNGIYSTSNTFPTIMNTVYGFFNTSWRESASRAMDDEKKNEFYASVYLTIRRFLMGVSLLIVGILPFIYNILINERYSEGYIYIPLMVLSVYCSNLASFSSGIFSAYKDTKILAPTTFVAAIINLVFNFLLINKLGLFAPILGTLISYIVINIYRNHKLKKYIVLPFDKYMVPNLFILGIVSLLYYSNNKLLYLLGLLIAIGYSYYINASLVNKIFKKIMAKVRR